MTMLLGFASSVWSQNLHHYLPTGSYLAINILRGISYASKGSFATRMHHSELSFIHIYNNSYSKKLFDFLTQRSFSIKKQSKQD